MSRSGYSEDYDEQFPNAGWLWMRAVENAVKGKRGQAFLRELSEALEALPNKRLIEGELERDGEVCAIGSVGVRRGIEMRKLDMDDTRAIGKAFRIPPALVAEIESTNDDDFSYRHETPEQRYERVLKWVREQIEP